MYFFSLDLDLDSHLQDSWLAGLVKIAVASYDTTWGVRNCHDVKI
jgi:hypothetical protein